MCALLEFDHICYWQKKGNRKQAVLKELSFSFYKGRLYTIADPSGSGKTILLALASALDTPHEGAVLYEGKDLKKIGLGQFRKKFASMVFQSHDLLPYMTALQNVVTAMEIKGTSRKNKKEYALEMLQKTGITEREARKKIGMLSSGQQQRVSIARALSCDAELIIADEPARNLDEGTAKEIVRLFDTLAHEEGKCVILATQDPGIAKASDVIVELSEGKMKVVSNEEKRKRLVQPRQT